MIYGEYRLYVEYRLSFTTQRLSVMGVPKGRIDLLDMIYGLHLDGIPNKDISDALNSRGVKSSRGKMFSTKLIWILIKKYKDRLRRQDSGIENLTVSESLFVVPIVINY
jgi:hypothetical protein